MDGSNTAAPGDAKRLAPRIDAAGVKRWVEVLIVPLTIALVGTGITYFHNRQQLEISRLQTMERFVTYFSPAHSAQQKLAALTTMMQLGYTDLTASFLVFSMGSAEESVEARVQLSSFVVAYGDALLPQFCRIVGSRSASVGDTMQIVEGYTREITSSAIGLTALVNLALLSPDETTQLGALSLLQADLPSRVPPDDADPQWGELLNGVRDRLIAFVKATAHTPLARGWALVVLARLVPEGEFGVRSDRFITPIRAFLHEVVSSPVYPLSLRWIGLAELERSLSSDQPLSELLDRMFEDSRQPYELRRAIGRMRQGTNEEVIAAMLKSELLPNRLLGAEYVANISEQVSAPLMLAAYDGESDFRVKDMLLSRMALINESPLIFQLLQRVALEEGEQPSLRAQALYSLASRVDDAREIFLKVLDEEAPGLLDAAVAALSHSDDEPSRERARRRASQVKNPELRSRLLSRFESRDLRISLIP